jgi:hypothetical protein
MLEIVEVQNFIINQNKDLYKYEVQQLIKINI